MEAFIQYCILHLHVERQDVPMISALGLEFLDPIIFVNPSEKLHLHEKRLCAKFKAY